MSLNLTGDPAIQRILVIRWSAMGDIAIASAIMEDIRRAFPQAEMHLNTLPPWDKLFREDPRFAKVFAIDLRRRKDKVRANLEWLREVRQGRYDLIVDLHATDRLRLLIGLLGLTGAAPRHRIGNHLEWPYTIGAAGLPNDVNPVARMQASLAAAGIPTRTPRPVLFVPERNRARARLLQSSHGLAAGRYALFFPGCQAAGYLKRWGVENYAGLARLLLAGEVERVVLIGGADESEDCRQIADAVGDGVVNLCGETEVLDILPLAEDAKLMVGNDTGTAHVASATPTPMVVICGPTDPNRVKPMGNNVVAIQADIPCINCYAKACSHHSCMRGIRPVHVLDALRKPRSGVVSIPALLLEPE